MDPSAIQEQISRILRSQSFANKGQLRRLLEVLSASIDSQTTLTPDLVIRELWPDETRTKRSADVATEMNRLRHALESYYTGEGKSDPITIFLPNRAAPAADGTHEKRWIVAKPRQEESAEAPRAIQTPVASPKANPHKVVKVAAAIVVLAVVGYIATRSLMAHDQPHSARLDGSTLTIVDAEGKELWRKAFPEGFATEQYYAQALATRIWIGDLDGDGHRSVLFLYLPGVNPMAHSSTLICYSDRGKEKWRWTPGRDLAELSGAPATYWTWALGVLKARDKAPARIVVTSLHNTWYPNQLALLDANGKTLSEYWHSGNISHLALADLDGDGRQEIVASGISNGYHQATLIVLDPDRVFGASSEPERPEIQIHGMGAAQERLRLLFPRSDLNKAKAVYNAGEDLTVQNGSIRLAVRECWQASCFIMYEFDRNMRLLTAYPSDTFRSIHAEFYLNGKDAHAFSEKEAAEFGKVRCLVGCNTDFVPVVTP